MPTFAQTQAAGSGNPANKPALTAKVTADNGGSFDGLLQPINQATFIANQAVYSATAFNSMRDALVAAGIMKAS